ncbi:hypothetical protein EDD15DRAFT_2373032 [Pisolithus albus]|nr:hypothetical protein EDD15DRAFT_2373032 [Pisolithus albus]
MPPSHFTLPLTPPSSKTDMTSAPRAKLGGTTTLCHGTPPTNGLKHPHFQLALPSDRNGISPPKRVKKLMMTATASLSEDVEELRSQRRLHIARATRDALAASLRYHQLRLREIELMRTMAIDECEEAEALLKAADRQVGEVKHILNCNDDDEDTDYSGLVCLLIVLMQVVVAVVVAVVAVAVNTQLKVQRNNYQCFNQLRTAQPLVFHKTKLISIRVESIPHPHPMAQLPIFHKAKLILIRVRPIPWPVFRKAKLISIKVKSIPRPHPTAQPLIFCKAKPILIKVRLIPCPHPTIFIPTDPV